MKKEVYTQQTIAKISVTAKKTLAIYILIAVFFAIFCGVFCYLAANDLVDIYLCCALNIVATICFLWYSYLFFAVISKPIFSKKRFVRMLDTCLPIVMVDKLDNCILSKDGYYLLTFQNGKVLKLEQLHGAIKEGVTYKVEQIDGILLSYTEVCND